MSFLFDREEIPPEVVRSIIIYCLDSFGADGVSGKSGTSHMAMMFLANWLAGFGKTGHLPISARYITGEQVNFSYTNFYLKGATERRGFFVSGKEDAAGNTVCISKAADAVWREKDRREWLLLIRY